MLGKRGDPAFVQNIQQHIEKRFRSLLPPNALLAQPSDPLLELCLSYISYAGVGAIVWWLNNGSAYSPHEVAIWLNQLSKANLDLALRTTSLSSHAGYPLGVGTRQRRISASGTRDPSLRLRARSG